MTRTSPTSAQAGATQVEAPQLPVGAGPPVTDETGERSGSGTSHGGTSLSTKLLLLTTLFVLLAEVLIFVPSVANFRMDYLRERVATAEIASVVFIADRNLSIPRDVQTEILAATRADAIVVRQGGESRLIARSSMPPSVNLTVDLDNWSPFVAVRDALTGLFTTENRSLRLISSMESREGELELLLREAPLIEAMRTYARNVALISLAIGLMTAALVFLTINAMIIRPVRSLSRNMVEFAEAPEEVSRILAPSKRTDEMGVAEHQLAAMQGRLHDTLRQQKRLADLGLAVSKINHDLRNILASAQLFSDRLADVDDPMVQKFAPRILRALDRAADYTQSVMAYGKAQDKPPSIRRINLHTLVQDCGELLDLGEAVSFHNLIPHACEVDADPDQMFRVIHNLCRNAVQALNAETDPAAVRRLCVCTEPRLAGDGKATQTAIIVADTGPGVPQRAREALFQAFKGSARPGGTGLGLAIAAELVWVHGGTVRLIDESEKRPACLDASYGGAQFEILLPNRG
ncbi:MAG: HAMP domain-containing sensor histidine kinase [Pseudomonadota bacterium]